MKETNRRVGPLAFDVHGLARRGLLLRHLMMPGMVEETLAILAFVAEELGPDTYVDLMAQFYPAGLVGKPGRDSYAEINRHVWREEDARAMAHARELGSSGWSSAASARGRAWSPRELTETGWAATA